ncbi:hypothetical protein T11_7106 [Trichinella zimbabwensis]|uniref:Uncharacterized protein n=1 Tax=Trichinella zimbabwensis TaxID=268475 RepID=A0A0V1HKW1_9BILA|nr:hypothetical protein T11_7106 [Trichinella zimbabwensis]
MGSAHHHDVADSSKTSEQMDLRIVPVAVFTMTDRARPSVPVSGLSVCQRHQRARCLRLVAAPVSSAISHVGSSSQHTPAASVSRDGRRPSFDGPIDAINSSCRCLSLRHFLRECRQAPSNQELDRGQRELVLRSTGNERKRTVIDSSLNLAQYRLKLIENQQTSSNRLPQGHLHRSHHTFPVSSAPGGAFREERPSDVFRGQLLLDGFPVQSFENALQEAARLVEGLEVV